MKTATAAVTLLCLASFGSGPAQQALDPPDKATLDRFLDRIADKNKGMGSLAIARDGNVLYSRSVGYSYVNGAERETGNRGHEIPDCLDHQDLHRRDDLSARRGRKTRAERHARPVLPKDIVAGAFDVYWKRPFEIPSFDPFAVSPDVLDRYVGVYSPAGAPVKLTVTRRGNTLYFQPPGEQSAVPLEATAENKFKIDPGVFFEFDAEKGQMTVTRPGGTRVFTRDKQFD
jgi:hypothetical protein